MATLQHFFRRSLRIASLSTFMGSRLAIALWLKPKTAPRLFRRYLEDCGGGFAKMGQLLATRYDLLPPRYIECLAGMLDRSSPLKIETIERVVEAELGHKLLDCYRTFGREPIGSASIAQVHPATLVDGTAVVVKVMRPDVEKDFEVDLFYLGVWARFIDALGVLGQIKLIGLIGELQLLTREELDFLRESRSVQLLHDLYESDEVRHHGPKVYFELTTRRVLTLERLKGVWVTDMLKALREGDTGQLEVWKKRGITPRRTARILMRSILVQIYHHRVFHADPHPANLVVRDDSSLGFVDFGIVGWVDERLGARMSRLFEEISALRIQSAYEALLDTLEPLPRGQRLSIFEREVKEIIWNWGSAARCSNTPPHEKGALFLLGKIAQAIRRAGLSMPWEATRAHRSLILSDAVVLALDPQIDPIQETAAFYREQRRRRRRELLSSESLDLFLEDSFGSVVAGIRAMGRLARWVEEAGPAFERNLRIGESFFERLVLRFLTMGAAFCGLITVCALIVWLFETFGFSLPPAWSFYWSWWQVAFAAGSTAAGLGILRRSLQN